MNQHTESSPDAATTIFNLSDYRVVSAGDEDGASRRVVIESIEPPGCPECGVIAVRVHSRRRQRVRDIPIAGAVNVVWAKRRWFCDERQCRRGTFAEATVQVPRHARSTGRLKTALKDAVVSSRRAGSEVAAAFGVSWWMVNTVVLAAAAALPGPDTLTPTRIGIDEHRYRSVRWFKDPAKGSWIRYEPWMSTIVDVDTGQVLGVVDGRDSRGVGEWLKSRSGGWRAAITTVGIDPSAAFRKALREHLPAAAVSIDHFHMVALANEAVTKARQRVANEQLGRRGRKTDLVWAHRGLLLRGYDTLSERGRERLNQIFIQDDPTDEISAAWGVKEALRIMLKTTDIKDLPATRDFFARQVAAADMPETTRLWKTVNKWWPEIETLIKTRVTTAKVEAANTMIKNIKRTARGFRNPVNYRARILLLSAARTTA